MGEAVLCPVCSENELMDIDKDPRFLESEWICGECKPICDNCLDPFHYNDFVYFEDKELCNECYESYSVKCSIIDCIEDVIVSKDPPSCANDTCQNFVCIGCSNEEKTCNDCVVNAAENEDNVMMEIVQNYYMAPEFWDPIIEEMRENGSDTRDVILDPYVAPGRLNDQVVWHRKDEYNDSKFSQSVLEKITRHSRVCLAYEGISLEHVVWDTDGDEGLIFRIHL